MVTRTGSWRRKARHILRKTIRTKGKVPLSRYFAKFQDGDKVLLACEPSIHKGLYHMRFHSKVGQVKGTRGRCYVVGIKDGNKAKDLVIHPVHLRKL